MPDVTGGAAKTNTSLVIAAGVAAPGEVQSSQPFWTGDMARSHFVVGSNPGHATSAVAGAE
ncbi:hypothetical protein AV521_31405 [Streptomyces sp. IMTB 2501]|uniref:hypothetical protein n=1 Tax=Streptomyces sp. IMTB 2501 TaxID=1776340 RepID=UPI00096CF705|nr:hypothetical protein [Streptomyces sp. IMTB 2501]OLZ65563.1 hypothetical protein AV521_31405 [Streptomyces sp. IMTB 2501]